MTLQPPANRDKTSKGHRPQPRNLHTISSPFQSRLAVPSSQLEVAAAATPMTGAMTSAEGAKKAATVGNAGYTSCFPLIRETKLWPILNAVRYLRYRHHEVGRC